MAACTKAHGTKINYTEKVHTRGQTGVDMRANTKMTRSTVMAATTGPMGNRTKAIGRRGSSTERPSSPTQKVRASSASGRTESANTGLMGRARRPPVV